MPVADLEHYARSQLSDVVSLHGADEREARRREQRVWTTFVRDQRIDDVTALRCLEALARRPDAQFVAAPRLDKQVTRPIALWP